MTFLLQGFGIGLVGLALADIFLTVLYARSGTGMFAPRVTHYAWRGMVLIAPVKLLNRNRFLSYGGPLMMVLSVALWVGMLLVGSAFAVWPALGSGIEATDGSTPAASPRPSTTLVFPSPRSGLVTSSRPLRRLGASRSPWQPSAFPW